MTYKQAINKFINIHVRKSIQKMCLVRISDHFNIHIHCKCRNNEIFIPNE